MAVKANSCVYASTGHKVGIKLEINPMDFKTEGAEDAVRSTEQHL